MLIIRPTKSLAKKLQVTLGGPDSTSPAASPLNEWYCNDFKFARTDFVIFVNPTTFFSLVLKAAPYGTLVDRFQVELPTCLKRLGFSSAHLDLHCGVQFVKTNDRSTIGVMVDYVKMLQFQDRLDRVEATDLISLASRLNRTPIIARKGKYAVEMLADLIGTPKEPVRQKLRLVT